MSTAEGETSSSKGKGRDQDEGAPEGGAPLFPGASDEWTQVHVERVEPVEEEGFLGRLPISATEQEIRGRWGGGRYLVRAMNARGQFKQNRTISIAGDPVFVSEVNAERWRRGLGVASSGRAGASSPAPAPAPQGLGLGEVMTLIQTLQASAQQQQQAWLQQQRADDERRRREDEQREERRRREDQEREERRAREANEARSRDQQFLGTMLQLIASKPAAAPDSGKATMEAFTLGLTTALKLKGGGGGEDEDDDQGEDEGGVAEVVKGAVRGLVDAVADRAGVGKGSSSSASSSSSAPALPAASSEPVTITGALGDQVKEFVAKASAAGKDPNALLAGAVGVLSKKLDKVSSSSSNGAGAASVAAAVAAVKGEGDPSAPS